MKKLLVICGPTATGKTELGIKLAQKFKGEIISADSRQVYRYMNIGTGKEKAKNISQWGLDLVKPDQEFSAAHFVEYAVGVIGDIRERGKLPIVVGGTGFWIKALIDGVGSIGISPDWELRQKLNNKTIEQLSNKLKVLDYPRWQRMNQSDRNNSRRLIRAIEIIKNQKSQSKAGRPLAEKLKIDELLMIGLKTKDYRSLYQRIDKRVNKRVKEGIEVEIRSLLNKGYTWDLPAFSATGYRVWREYLEANKSLSETVQHWQYEEHGLARRQLTYFKKDKRIKWFDIDKPIYQQIEKLVGEWYSENS